MVGMVVCDKDVSDVVELKAVILEIFLQRPQAHTGIDEDAAILGI
jgi:hypothetical protein